MGSLEGIPFQLRALPIGVLALSILFAVYAYGRRREVSELKLCYRDCRSTWVPRPRNNNSTSLADDHAVAAQLQGIDRLLRRCGLRGRLDGTLRTVNKRITELTGLPYAEIVSRKIYDFVDEPVREEVEQGLGRFLEKRHWTALSGCVLRNRTRPLYFECVLNAITKGDEVVGVSVLGRDVTEQREKELRFTELFETLQEGVYFSTPEGKLLDANPALVAVLGYATRRAAGG